MSKITAFIKQHPVLTYTALTFAISWGWIFSILSRSVFEVNGEQSEKMFIFMNLAMLVGPSLAGILLTGVVDGRAGLRDLFSRLLRWRLGVRWYAAGLLITPLVILAILLMLTPTFPSFLPRLFVEEDTGFLLQFSFIAGLTVGIFEELGWTGFAVHTMLKRHYSVLSTGLIVGLLFGAWNGLMVYLLSGTPSGKGDLSLVVFLPATLFTWLPTYRVLMVWVYDRTGSLPLAMLMYASLIAFWRILTPLALSGLPLVAYYLIFSAAIWIIIIAVLRWRALPGAQAGDAVRPVG